MNFSYREIKQKLSNSSLFKDSLFAVFGNGMGNFLLLLSGIVIARFLGKDIYGEYGLVKTTMFHIAAFATLGLGFTSTRFVAKYKDSDNGLLKGTIYTSTVITLMTSCVLCLLLFVFAGPLANYLDEPRLALPFKFLGVIIILKALSTTSGAILGGYKDFKTLGVNTVISGLSMLILGIGLTYIWGLKGSLTALALSQLLLCILNHASIHKSIIIPIRGVTYKNNYKTILKFTIPVALQELSYTLSQWGTMLILTKFGSLGQVGLYSAAGQWNAIILFIPSLLSNVVLSYLSGASSDKEQKKTVRLMLLINLSTTFLPFLIVFLLSGFIVGFYGETFIGMKSVMNILVFSTIFDCMSRVFQSNLISEGKNWLLFTFRATRDTAALVLAYVLLSPQPESAAKILAVIHLLICFVYFLLMGIEYLITHRKEVVPKLTNI